MGSIPLPALQLRPPENPADQFLRFTQIRNLMTQGREEQLALQDDLAGRSAWQKAAGDPDRYLTELGKAGVSPRTIMAQQQLMTDMRQKAATLTKTQLENAQTQNDQYRGKLLAIVKAPDAEKQAQWEQEVIREEQAGTIQPGSMTHVYPGDDVATSFANHFALGSTLAKEAYEQKAAEARSKTAETGAQRLTLEAPGILARTTISQQEAGMTPEQRAMQGNLPYQAAQGSAPAAAALNLETGQKAAVAGAEATARVGAEMKAYGQNLAAVAGVPPHLVSKALDDYQKAGQEYAESQNAAQDMRTFIDMARSGNKVAYAYSPVEGVLQFNTARGIKRVNMAEIESYGGAGSGLDRVRAFLGKQSSGASIPAGVLNDMESLHGAIGDNAQKLYQNKLKVINSAYGSKFQPVELGGTGGTTGGGAAQGYTRIQASDGSIHDIPSNKLDAVRQRDPGLKVVQ